MRRLLQRDLLVKWLKLSSGGTVLTRLVDSSLPEIKDLSITALVRKQEQADVLKNKGIDTIVFKGLDDLQFLKKVASEHGYVLRTVTGSHDGSAVALIEGLAERKKQTGKDIHYIHVSHLLDRNFAMLLESADLQKDIGNI